MPDKQDKEEIKRVTNGAFSLLNDMLQVFNIHIIAAIFCVHNEDGSTYKQSICEEPELANCLDDTLTKIYGKPIPVDKVQ